MRYLWVFVREAQARKREGRQAGRQSKAKTGTGLKPRRCKCAHHQLIDTLVLWWVEKGDLHEVNQFCSLVWLKKPTRENLSRSLSFAFYYHLFQQLLTFTLSFFTSES
ncbi:hypothetical protein CY35_10G033400 [Sphagnum magellanicum]|nr:hypothetical protein CY35_10G033400 [Sphagnum magellanicum]